MKPRPRIIVSTPDCSTDMAPMSRPAARTASISISTVRPCSSRRFGSTSMWYSRTTPPAGATSETPAHPLQRRHHHLIEDEALALGISGSAEGEGEDLAHGRGIGSELGLDAGWQHALDLREALDRARTAGVEVAVLLEDDIDVAGAEQRHAAHHRDAGQSLQLAGETPGHLLIDILRRGARPLRPHDDLIVRKIGDRIERHPGPCPRPGDGDGAGHRQGQQPVADAPGDHGDPC